MKTRFSFGSLLAMLALSIATAAILLAVTEMGARFRWPRAEQDTCEIHTPAGDRFRPNCSSSLKTAEGPWTTDSYNECGYRTTAPCGAKPAGTIRIVMLGSSMTHGAYVPYDKTFATELGAAVQKDLREPVQVENLGVMGFSPLDTYRRLDEAMKLDPDVVVFSVAPHDMEAKIDPEELARRNDPVSLRPMQTEVKKPRLLELKLKLEEDSTSADMAQYFRFRDTNVAIEHFLAGGNNNEYLRQPMPAEWQARLADLKVVVNDMAACLKARHIPLVMMAIPSRIEAALLRPERFKSHFDAFAFGQQVQTIAAQAQVAYVDLMHPFGQLSRPEDLYFVVNSHPNSAGNAAIAQQLIPIVERILRKREPGDARSGS